MDDLENDLLNDFDYDEDEQVEEQKPDAASLQQNDAMEQDGDSDEEQAAAEPLNVPEGGVKPADELDADDVAKLDTASMATVSAVARLAGSSVFQEALQKVEHYSGLPPSDLSSADSAEYKLIVQVNNFAVEIDNEVMLVHKFIRDHYAPRFIELESLGIATPLDYCKAVKAIGNPDEFDKTVADRVKAFLPSATVMVVAVMAVENTGRQLSETEWQAVEQACDMMLSLDAAKRKILDYVESRIALLSPNFSAIVGSRTATKLLGIAGGLPGLSRTPSCNLHLFGAQKRAAIGMSSGSYSAQRRHVGFIYSSPLVQSVPEEYRGKAQRTVSAKCALAIRADLNESYKDGQYGIQLSNELQTKLDKLVEPPPAKVTKALPVPTEGPKKRRGGRRARKAKEAYATSELQKMRNRMAFGKEEEETGAYDETAGMGMIGASSGRIRANAGETRTKAKLSKRNKGRLEQMRGGGSGSATSGLSSSLAFTPVQGLELADPSAKKRLEAAQAGWFKETGTFSVMPGAASKKSTPASFMQ